LIANNLLAFCTYFPTTELCAFPQQANALSIPFNRVILRQHCNQTFLILGAYFLLGIRLWADAAQISQTMFVVKYVLQSFETNPLIDHSCQPVS
jgi:hypothetical protein